MAEVKVGRIIKFFSKPGVAAIELTDGSLRVGERIRLKGHTTDFEQVIGSMEIDNQAVEKAQKGQFIGIKVTDRVRPNDEVFRIVD